MSPWISECAGAGLKLFYSKIQPSFLLLVFKPVPTRADYDDPIRVRTLAKNPWILGDFLQSKALLQAKVRYSCFCNLWDFSAVNDVQHSSDALPELVFYGSVFVQLLQPQGNCSSGKGLGRKMSEPGPAKHKKCLGKGLTAQFSKTGNKY